MRTELQARETTVPGWDNKPDALHRYQRPMGRVGRRSLHTPPANQISGPITPSSPLATCEFLVANWLAVLPAAVGIPVIRDNRLRTSSCAGQHEEITSTFDQVSHRPAGFRAHARLSDVRSTERWRPLTDFLETTYMEEADDINPEQGAG